MKKIITLPGDGIGPEIMDAALSVLDVASEGQFEYEIAEHAIGGHGIDSQGHPFPEATREACLTADAILLGAIGGPKWEQSEVTPEMGLLQMRKVLGLFSNLRPIQLNETLIDRSPLKPEIVSGTDMMIVRELTGGLYFGEPKWEKEDEALDTTQYSRSEIERIIHLAFKQAQNRRNHLTSVDKANVLSTSRLWRRIVNEIAPQYPDVHVDHLYIDAASMKLVTHPKDFDVVVTANLFGDILSDEASVITGSLGMMPSASMNEQGLGLYEPIHGSAPDIAGKNLANPMSMIYSITMMLRTSFEEFELADKIEAACEAVMARNIMTKDMGGTETTESFTKAVITELRK